MKQFLVHVIEVLHVNCTYVVEADYADQARKKAQAGESVMRSLNEAQPDVSERIVKQATPI